MLLSDSPTTTTRNCAGGHKLGNQDQYIRVNKKNNLMVYCKQMVLRYTRRVFIGHLFSTKPINNIKKVGVGKCLRLKKT